MSNHLVVMVVVDLGDDETADHRETVHQAVVRLRDLVRPQLGELVGNGEVVGVWVGIDEYAERVILASSVELAQ